MEGEDGAAAALTVPVATAAAAAADFIPHVKLCAFSNHAHHQDLPQLPPHSSGLQLQLPPSLLRQCGETAADGDEVTVWGADVHVVG